VLTADKAVNPTISLKYIVTESKLSASTGSPRFSDSATDLEAETREQKEIRRISQSLN